MTDRLPAVGEHVEALGDGRSFVGKVEAVVTTPHVLISTQRSYVLLPLSQWTFEPLEGS